MGELSTHTGLSPSAASDLVHPGGHAHGGLANPEQAEFTVTENLNRSKIQECLNPPGPLGERCGNRSGVPRGIQRLLFFIDGRMQNRLQRGDALFRVPMFP